jgi:hypothetical protein
MPYFRLAAVLSTMLLASLAPASVVRLAWDPSDPDVTGYRLHYGSASGNYSTVIDVGNATSWAVPDLVVGRTYFFAVTAYNALGTESDFSSEIVYAPPLRIDTVAADENGATLTWDSPPGAIFRVLTARTLTNPVWVDVSGPILSLSESTSWTHVRTSSDSTAFYRLEVVSLPLAGVSSLLR